MPSLSAAPSNPTYTVRPMNSRFCVPFRPLSKLSGALVPLLLAACAGSAGQTEVAAAPSSGGATFQPGAPGTSARAVDAAELASLDGPPHTEADVAFMTGMIPHHAQALEMTALVPRRAGSEAVRQMALRMEISQRDEIALMEGWLADRGETVSEGHAHHMSSMPMMPGMLSPEQMKALEQASGREFDRLFLEYMIQHHEGAIVMVNDLFNSSGAAQESEIFQFASHVDADQRMEISRMQGLLDRMR